MSQSKECGKCGGQMEQKHFMGGYPPIWRCRTCEYAAASKLPHPEPPSPAGEIASEMEGMPPCKHCTHPAESHDDEFGNNRDSKSIRLLSECLDSYRKESEAKNEGDMY